MCRDFALNNEKNVSHLSSLAELLEHLIHWSPKITNLVMSNISTNSGGGVIYYPETLWGPAQLYYADKHGKKNITVEAWEEASASGTLLRTHLVSLSGMGRICITMWGLLWIANRRERKVPIRRVSQRRQC